MGQNLPLGQEPLATSSPQGQCSPQKTPIPVYQEFPYFKHKKLFPEARVCGRCGRHLLYTEYIPLLFVDWSSKDVEYDWGSDTLVLPLYHCDKYVTVNIDSRDTRIIGEWTNLCGTTQYKRSALSPFLKSPPT